MQDTPFAFSTLVEEANSIMLPRDCQGAHLENRVREITAHLDARAATMIGLAERVRSASARPSRAASPAPQTAGSQGRRLQELVRREPSAPARDAAYDQHEEREPRASSLGGVARPHVSSALESLDNKRPRTETREEDFSAAAAGAKSGAAVRIEDDWPADVRVFYPELGRTNAAISAAGEALNKLARALFADESLTATEMSGRQFSTSELRFALSSEYFPDEEVRDWLNGLVHGLCDLQHRIVRAATASKRAFDLYSLATQTQGGSWLAVQQLLFREVYDEQKVSYDPSYRPLTTWAEKVAAALVACEQANALSKDGAPMGPVSPAVAKALQRRQFTGGGAHAAGAERRDWERPARHISRSHLRPVSLTLGMVQRRPVRRPESLCRAATLPIQPPPSPSPLFPGGESGDRMSVYIPLLEDPHNYVARAVGILPRPGFAGIAPHPGQLALRRTYSSRLSPAPTDDSHELCPGVWLWPRCA